MDRRWIWLVPLCRVTAVVPAVGTPAGAAVPRDPAVMEGGEGLARMTGPGTFTLYLFPSLWYNLAVLSLPVASSAVVEAHTCLSSTC